jgi:TolA-binding protein
MLEKMRKTPGGEKNKGNPMRAQAVQEYKLCAQRFPDPPFGPLAVAKVVDYYVESQDYAQATALLEQVFVDYPDQKFLDAMLLKWVIVAFASGDFSKARDKCNQLIADFPESPYAAKAKKILPQIEAKLNSGAAAAAVGETSETPKTSEKKE